MGTVGLSLPGNFNATGITLATAYSGAGINVQQFVNQALQAELATEQGWKTQQSTLSAQTAVAQSINSDLLDLQNQVNALQDVAGGFNAVQATSSDPTVVTASAGQTAVAGSHQITVSSLATTSSYYSSELANSSTAFGTGSFTLQVGSGQPTTITVDSTNNTLDSLAAYINNQNLGVTASVVTDSGGARLSLVSQTSGAAGEVTISNNTTGLNFTEGVTGADASLTVDGIPIDSSTNTISTVLPGVTLNLVGTSSNPVTVTAQPDTTSASQAIQNFVSSYNTLVQAINAQFNYDPNSGQPAPPLFADSSLELVQQQILSALSYSIPGNNGLVNLASLGINVQNDGTLTVDQATLNGALSGNFSAAQNLLQSATPAGWAVNFGNILNSLTDSVNGPLNVELSGINQQQNNLSQQISDFNARLAVQQQQLTQQFSQVDALLQQLPLTLEQIQSQLATV